MSQLVYNFLIEEKEDYIPGCMTMWGIELNEMLDKAGWFKLMPYIHKITMSTKLRYLQYRLLKKRITTNLERSKYEDVSPLCYFCKAHVETLLHLLVFRRKILCDAKPKPVPRKFQSKSGRKGNLLRRGGILPHEIGST